MEDENIETTEVEETTAPEAEELEVKPVVDDESDTDEDEEVSEEVA